VPDTKFFHVAEFEIAGHKVKGIRHGMVGQPGFEVFGPWSENEDVLNALLEAGKTRGLERLGSQAYFTSPAVNGW
jgi:glycine cleavage system aminomethyltransferase T